MINLRAIFVVFGLGCLAACSSEAPQISAPEIATQGPAPEIAPWTAAHDWSENFPSWANPIAPFNIIENIYYVGTEGLSSFLITSASGHILIDGGLPENAPIIAANIKALGFEITDVEILLNSHAHFDHSGGLAELKRASGAKFIASEGDKSALEGGFYLGAEDNAEYFAPPIAVDEIIADGDIVIHANIALRANITPGHSRGCTSWTTKVQHQDKDLEVLFFCSATVAGNRLIPPQYPGIVDDYKLTFDKTRNWRPDVFLSNHPSFFGMEEKHRNKQNDPLAFVDRDGFPNMMDRLEIDFKDKLAKAKAASNPP